MPNLEGAIKEFITLQAGGPGSGKHKNLSLEENEELKKLQSRLGNKIEREREKELLKKAKGGKSLGSGPSDKAYTLYR